MSQVRCIAYEGVKMWFYSNDHEPPHFHAKRRGEWEYRVKFMEDRHLLLEKVWGHKAMPKACRTWLLEAVAKNRFALLKEWEANVCDEAE